LRLNSIVLFNSKKKALKKKKNLISSFKLKHMKSFYSLLIFLTVSLMANQLCAQAIFSGDINDAQSLKENMLGCGSHELLKCAHNHHPGILEEADVWMKNIAKKSKNAHFGKSNNLYEIPVVFHIVYNNEEENLPDSVIENQIAILNDSFRRTNADAVNTRPEFLDHVGDAHIEFKLAEIDPDGLPTNGIVRTNTDVEYFGGILPYGPGQNNQIIQWVNDSLLYNFFRLANTSMGGQDPWDTQRYLNIWVGDLRILEPAFNNFEELVYFGLATPPLDHFNWPLQFMPSASNLQDGVYMHYINIGPNNPNIFPAPYDVYNGISTTGKMLVHEVGHYLGLRHIWGDGNCSVDDFIDDTPNASAHSQWACNLNANTCTDNINGIDLPDMVENYMDYSTGNCQNAFTQGQINLMRSVLEDYRTDLAEVIVSHTEDTSTPRIKLYPNPNSGLFNLELSAASGMMEIQIINNIGQTVHRQNYSGSGHLSLNLNLSPGLYLLQLNSNTAISTVERFIVQ